MGHSIYGYSLPSGLPKMTGPYFVYTPCCIRHLLSKCCFNESTEDEEGGEGDQEGTFAGFEY